MTSYKSILAIILIGVMILLGGISSVSASFDMANYTINDTYSNVRAQYWKAQTFLVTQSGTVGNISLSFYTTGSPGNLIVGIRNIDGSSLPTGNDLCNGTINVNSGYTTARYYNISMSSGCGLSAGNTYSWVVRVPTGDDSNLISLDANSPGSYTGGNAVTSGDSGASWSASAGDDFIFKIWGAGSPGTLSTISTTLISPATGNTTVPSTIVLVANHTGSGIDLKNATFYIWNSNSTVWNKTSQTINGATNQSLNNFTFVNQGNYLWNVLSCGTNATDTLCSYATSNYTLSIVPFSLVTNRYNQYVYETSRQNFSASITTLSSVLSVSSYLNYGSKRYSANTTCSGGSCSLLSLIDVPINTGARLQNNSFLWEVIVYDGTTSYLYNTSSASQQVEQIWLAGCNSTFTTKTLNFTAYAETNFSRINPYNFYGTFNYWLGYGTVMKNASFNNASISEKTLCIFPGNITINTTAQIDYSSADNSSFVPRNYYLSNAEINSVTNNISLFLLDTDLATTFILKVQDITRNPIAGALINIQRCYTELGYCATVQVAKTDSNGKSVGFYKTETVDYKHIISLNGTVLLVTDQQKIFGEEVPYTLLFTVGESSPYPWYRFESLSNVYYSLYFNSTNSMVYYTFIDTSGLFNLGRLVVLQTNLSGNYPVICNITSMISSATLTCNMSTYSNGFFEGYGYIQESSTDYLVSMISFVITNVVDVMGPDGLFLGFFIILVSGFAFFWHPIAGVWAVTVTMIFLNLIGLVAFSPVWIFSSIGIAIILTWIMKG